MRRLSDIQERRYGRDTPEREFLVTAGDAGAHVIHDRASDSYVLTFDDKESADDFKKEHLPDSAKVWRDSSGDVDRFQIEVDWETASQSFTPEPDDYATESVRRSRRKLTEGMSVTDLGGGDFTVTVDPGGVADFKDQWPGSDLPDNEEIWFTFEKNGDLVDLSDLGGYDGGDVVALADDAKAFGKAELKAGRGVREGRREKPTASPEGDPDVCHHLIRHAVTDAERKAAKKALDYARSVDDTQGTMIALAQLQGCPTTSPSALG